MGLPTKGLAVQRSGGARGYGIMRMVQSIYGLAKFVSLTDLTLLSKVDALLIMLYWGIASIMLCLRCKDLREEVAFLQAHLEDAETEMETAKSATEEAIQKLDSLRSKLDDAEWERDNAIDEAETAKNELEALMAQLQETEGDRDTANEEAEIVKQELSSLREDLDEVELERDMAQKEASTATTEHVRLKNELKWINEELEQLREEIKVLKKTITQTQSK